MPYLPERDGHQVYYECRGTAVSSPTPILFIHGGPGAGCSDADRKLFDQVTERPVIFLDQRGCGKSKAENRLSANTTQKLIDDIERLRKELNLERLILVGGSWGSTLSLSYAISHPERVERMILWGIFLCSIDELNWFYQDGANWIFPQEYEKFATPIQDKKRLIAEYHKLVTTGELIVRKQYASKWARWEAINSFINPNEATLEKFSDPEGSLSMVILETYYFSNGAFFNEDNFLLHNLHKIANIPLDIVHGQYDTICPTRSAWLVTQKLPKATLHISKLAAHDATENENKEMLKALLKSLS